MKVHCLSRGNSAALNGARQRGGKLFNFPMLFGGKSGQLVFGDREFQIYNCE